MLIGPAGAGKTTVGSLVAYALGTDFVDADAQGDPYYAEVGWSIDRLTARIAAVGRAAAEQEWEPARAHAVARLVETGAGSVLALGAGHTSYTRDEHRATVRAALRSVPTVVLLLPDEDPGRALDVLRMRCRADKGTDWVRDGHDFLAAWLAEPEHRWLATHVVTTATEAPGETAIRVAALARAQIVATDPESTR